MMNVLLEELQNLYGTELGPVLEVSSEVPNEERVLRHGG